MNYQLPKYQKYRGAVAVELAFIAIPLVFMVLATIDFARAMFVYDQLAKAARDGARYLSFFDPTIAAEYPTDMAKSRMIYGTANPADGATPIVPGLTPEMIEICDRINSGGCAGGPFGDVPTPTSGTINLVRVSITGYTFNPSFPGASRLAAFTFEPISVTMRQLY
ncbi:MAG: pilus assembly protein [Rhodocyclaceae bacterium]|nr:pilus assembly protein [Rhodocyclaceae bacterium]